MNKDFIEYCLSVLDGGLVLCFAGCLKCFVKFTSWLLSGFSTFETNTKKKKAVLEVFLFYTESLCLYKILPRLILCPL